MKKSFNYLVGLLVGLLVMMVVQWPSSKLKMVVCDVGQGDGILIIQGQNQILVDGGPSGSKILACLREQMPFWDREIELIVMTNSDRDHSSGLTDVLDRYEVMHFVTGDGLKNTQTLERLVGKLNESQVDVRGVERGDEVVVSGNDDGGELMMRVLWPAELDREKVAVITSESSLAQREQILGVSANSQKLNERSVVMLLEWEGYKILLTGDSGDQTEKWLLEQGELEDIDVLKVGHHGSKYSSSLEFLQALEPELAVISVGKNSYGHPTSEVLSRLSEVGAKIRRTDEEGSVVVVFGE